MFKDALFWDAEVLLIIAWGYTFEFFPNIPKCDTIMHGRVQLLLVIPVA